MRKLFFRILFFIVLFLYLPFISLAWGMLGHRIVGEVASSYLTPAARKQIEQILGYESIAIASNWPDFIKSDTAYKYLNSWHYADFDNKLDKPGFKMALEEDTETDAYTRLKFLIAKLKDKKQTHENKLMYLRLLIHIVGDIHQPLHVSGKGDAGGNGIKVNWFNEASNMHRVWDEQLIEFQQLSYTEYTAMINHPTLKQRKLWQQQPMSDWLYGSYAISEQIRGEVKADQKLSYQYNFKWVSILNEQLLKGGVRLAGLLNQIFQ